MQVTDHSIEKVVSIVLRTGVVISGLIVLCGGICFLMRHGSEPAQYHTFQAQGRSGYDLLNIFRGAFQGAGRSIIQVGVLCLVATPILRVIVSLVGFAFERDRTYVLITFLVLAILLYGLVSGATGSA